MRGCRWGGAGGAARAMRRVRSKLTRTPRLWCCAAWQVLCLAATQRGGCTYPGTYMVTQAHMRACTHAQTHAHAHTCTHTCAHTCTFMHACTCTHLRKHIPACTRTRTRVCKRTCTHTHTRMPLCCIPTPPLDPVRRRPRAPAVRPPQRQRPRSQLHGCSPCSCASSLQLPGHAHCAHGKPASTTPALPLNCVGKGSQGGRSQSVCVWPREEGRGSALC